MTAPLLVIDASTYRGTAALVEGPRILGETDARMRGADEERLMPAVARLLRDAALHPRQLAGVVCGEGPGSFTSLRIAASIAKGVVTGTTLPLFAVSSLLLVVAGIAEPPPAGRYLALLDAMRGEWFGARVSVDGEGMVDGDEEFAVMNQSEIRETIEREHRIAIGPGQSVDGAPHARGLARIRAASAVVHAVDPVGWEPKYGRLAEAQARWEQSHGRPLAG